MSINFHDANNKYTYATRNAHVSWEEMIKNITDIQNKQIIDIGHAWWYLHERTCSYGSQKCCWT